MDTGTPAVVLKLDPNVMHHGGLGVIRSLGRLGVPVYGVHEHALAPAANSRYLAGRWIWRPPTEAARLVDGLRALAGRIGRPAVLLPTDDAGAIFLAEHGEPLRQHFLFPDPPPPLPRQLAGKYSLYEQCVRLGVPCPRAVVPADWAQARDFATDTGYPVVAKLVTPWRVGKADLPSTSIVPTESALRTVVQTGADLMLQEYVPGGRGHDWFFHGYADRASRCRPAFTGTKERSYPPHAGLTTMGRSVANPRLAQQAADLVERVGFRGIVDLDYRWDERTGRYLLLDFNPRLGAQFRLFCTTAGVDVARAAYLDLTGAPIPAGPPVLGRGFLVESYDPISALRYWRRGELGLTAWASSLRGVDETAWFARDDLAPFGLMCLRQGWRVLDRPFGRGRRPQTGPPRYRRGRAALRPRVTAKESL